MARSGRKRKAGAKRGSTGRIVRDHRTEPGLVQPSDWVKGQRDRYGEHYSSPIGRLYARGFLGEGTEAKNRLDTGKRFSRLYRAIIGGDGYRCPLNPDPRSGGQRTAFHDDLRERESQDWLFDAMNKLDKAGLRGWLDAVLSTEYTDRGPVWADRLLMGGRDPYDHAMLKNAIAALDEIAPVVRPVGILAIAS